MDSLGPRLLEELNSETAFTLPLFGGIEIAESTVMSWIIIAILTLLAIWVTSDLKVHHISKKQAAAEAAVVWLNHFVEDMIGEEGIKYVPYLVSVLLYIGVSNVIGIVGVKPPTKDLCVTTGLALLSILLIEWAGVSKKGVKNWLHSFIEPIPVIAPINVLEIFIRPLSLCMRLFGNVLGAYVIMELIKIIIPIGIPLVFSLYFDLFDGLIQAYVFVFLTSLFIKEAIE